MMEFIRFKRGQQQAKYIRLEPQFEGNAFLPQYTLVPLASKTQMSSLPLVSVGDFVNEGQMVARAGNSSSAHVHASVPGIVSGIVDTQLPNGHSFRGLHIKTGGSFSILGKQRTPYLWKQSDQIGLIHFLDLAGLVNTSGETISLAEDIRAAVKQGVKTLTVMLYDKDPTCMLDSFLARRFIREVAEGIGIIAQAMGATKIIVETGTEKKDRALFDTIGTVISDHDLAHLTIPQTYPAGNTYTRSAEKDAVVIDASTALSVYESVQHNQPMLTTYLLLTGKTLEHATVIKVRIGTPIGHLIEECGGFKSKNTHIILNGLLRGTLVDSLDLPVGKGIKSIHAVGKDIDIQQQLDECDHCGQCLRSCPAYIDPINTVRHIQRERYTAETLRSIALCSSCACCSAVCPVRIPLSAIIKSAAKRGDSYAV